LRRVERLTLARVTAAGAVPVEIKHRHAVLLQQCVEQRLLRVRARARARACRASAAVR
jgi:hypothetical protein